MSTRDHHGFGRLATALDDQTAAHSQLLSLGLLGQISVEEQEEALHLGVKGLECQLMRAFLRGAVELTFFLDGSETLLTMLLSSFLMVLAATPVVAERKSCEWARKSQGSGGDHSESGRRKNEEGVETARRTLWSATASRLMTRSMNVPRTDTYHCGSSPLSGRVVFWGEASHCAAEG